MTYNEFLNEFLTTTEADGGGNPISSHDEIFLVHKSSTLYLTGEKSWTRKGDKGGFVANNRFKGMFKLQKRDESAGDTSLYHGDVVFIVQVNPQVTDNALYRAFYGGGYFEKLDTTEQKQQFRILIKGGTITPHKLLRTSTDFVLQSVYAESKSSEETKSLGTNWSYGNWSDIGSDYGTGDAKYIGVQYNANSTDEIRTASIWNVRLRKYSSVVQSNVICIMHTYPIGSTITTTVTREDLRRTAVMHMERSFWRTAVSANVGYGQNQGGMLQGGLLMGPLALVGQTMAKTQLQASLGVSFEQGGEKVQRNDEENAHREAYQNQIVNPGINGHVYVLLGNCNICAYHVDNEIVGYAAIPIVDPMLQNMPISCLDERWKSLGTIYDLNLGMTQMQNKGSPNWQVEDRTADSFNFTKYTVVNNQ